MDSADRRLRPVKQKPLGYKHLHPSCIMDFRERAAIFDHTVWGALSPTHTSRAPGFATQDHARARDSNAAQGNAQDMEATSANL
jgi:hypothetical protein